MHLPILTRGRVFLVEAPSADSCIKMRRAFLWPGCLHPLDSTSLIRFFPGSASRLSSCCLINWTRQKLYNVCIHMPSDSASFFLIINFVAHFSCFVNGFRRLPSCLSSVLNQIGTDQIGSRRSTVSGCLCSLPALLFSSSEVTALDLVDFLHFYKANGDESTFSYSNPKVFREHFKVRHHR